MAKKGWVGEKTYWINIERREWSAKGEEQINGCHSDTPMESRWDLRTGAGGQGERRSMGQQHK